MSAAHVCDFCGCVVKDAVAAQWMRLSRCRELFIFRDNPDRIERVDDPLDKSREFCSDECLVSWIRNGKQALMATGEAPA